MFEGNLHGIHHKKKTKKDTVFFGGAKATQKKNTTKIHQHHAGFASERLVNGVLGLKTYCGNGDLEIETLSVVTVETTGPLFAEERTGGLHFLWEFLMRV